MATLLYNDIVHIEVADAKQAKLNDLVTLGFTTTSWQEGSNSLLQVELSAELESKLSDISVYFRDAFLPSAPTCVGDTLTKTSSGFFNNDRAPAQPAQHLVTLACAATQGPYTIHQGDLVVSYVSVDKSIQATFRNIDGNAITYPVTLTSGGTLQLLFQAETAGAQANVGDDLSNAGANTTFTLVTTLAGVTITAHQLFQSGTDDESDDRLKRRNQTKWGASLSNLGTMDERVEGTLLALYPTIQSVAVDSTNPRGQGTFDVYVAGLDDTASDNDVLNAQITIDLITFGRNNVPKTALVKKAPTFALDLAGVVYYTGATQAVVQAAVEAALVAFLRSLKPGGSDYSPGGRNIIAKNDIETVIKNAVTSVASTRATVLLTTPSGDSSVVTFGKVIRGNWSGLLYQQLQS